MMTEWIKCSERMPERGQRVLVAQLHRKLGIERKRPFITIGVLDDYITGEELFFTPSGHIMTAQPELWMPLPEVDV